VAAMRFSGFVGRGRHADKTTLTTGRCARRSTTAPSTPIPLSGRKEKPVINKRAESPDERHETLGRPNSFV
jgi:hypothetical protein